MAQIFILEKISKNFKNFLLRKFFLNIRIISIKLFKMILKYLLHLSSLEDPIQIFSDSKSLQSFKQICKTIYFSRGFKFDYDAFLVHNFDKFLLAILNYFYEKRGELVFDSDNHQYTVAFGQTIYLANNLVVNSMKCSEKCITNGLLDIYLKFLNDENFIQKNLNAKVDFIEKTSNFLDQLVMVLKNLTEKTCDNYKHLYLNSNVPETMVKIAKMKETCKLDAYLTLIYVCSDSHLEDLVEIDSVLNLIFKLIQKCYNEFRDEKFFRQKFEINFNENYMNYEVHCIKYAKLTSVSMDSLLDSFYRLSINDKIKIFIYFKLEINSYLQEFLQIGN